MKTVSPTWDVKKAVSAPLINCSQVIGHQDIMHVR